MVCEKCWADAALLARSEGTSQTEAYYKILARHNHDSTARIRELEQQLAAAQERNTVLQSEHLDHVNALHQQLTDAQERERQLNDELYYACELAIAYAHSEKDKEWAAERIEELMPPEQEVADESL